MTKKIQKVQVDMMGIQYYWSKNVWSKICHGLKYVWSKICPILFTGLKYVTFIYWSKRCQSKRCRSKRCQSKRCHGTNKSKPVKLETSHTGVIPPTVSVLWLGPFYIVFPVRPYLLRVKNESIGAPPSHACLT